MTLTWYRHKQHRYPGIESHRIVASQGLRSALLNFTLGIARRIFEVTREGLYVMQLVAHCHLLDFDSYAPCNDVIFSQSTRGFNFLTLECPEN
jgi:hypothetical protein